MIQTPYFKEQILRPALLNDEVPAVNKDFLNALNDYLDLGWKEELMKPTLEKPIFPVFFLKESQSGIVNVPKTICDRTPDGRYSSCNDFSYERSMVRKHKEVDSTLDYSFYQEAEFTKSKLVYNAIDPQSKVYIFEANGKERLQIEEFGFYEGECLTYYHYGLEKPNNKRRLIGSSFDLELEFGRYPGIDKLIADQYKDCWDCRTEFEPEIAFAKIKGVDNMYFTYTDSFDDENQYFYPTRSLVVILNTGEVATLWSESIDLFGCSCL